MWSSASCSGSTVRERGQLKASVAPQYWVSRSLRTASQTPTGLASLPHYRLTSSSVRSTLDALEIVAQHWRAGSIAMVDQYLGFCEEYLDPQTLDMVPCFVGCGGISLFCELLCDPIVPTERRARTHYINALSCFMVVLTEIIVRHNKISWYIYDRYPGVFFRLVELLGVAQLNNTALSMLEHLLSVVGPVMEIVKNKALMALIREDVPFLLGGLCRVLALLVIPGNALQQSSLSSRHLLYPEVIAPIRRVQRVVDSNVLWLQSEAGLVNRLITLCEVRSREIRVQQGGRTTTVLPTPTVPTTSLNNAAGTPNNAQPVMLQAEVDAFLQQLSQVSGITNVDMATLQAQFEPLLRSLREFDGAVGGNHNGLTMMSRMMAGEGANGGALAGDDEYYDDEEDDEELSDEDEGYDDGAEWETEGSSGESEDDASTEEGVVPAPSTQPFRTDTNGAGVPGPAASASASVAPRAPTAMATATAAGPSASAAPAQAPAPAPANEAAARVVQELINEEAMLENELNTEIDLDWFCGSVDARERWRLRDLTLAPDRDDTRPTLLGYGSIRDDAAVRRFTEANAANLAFLQANNHAADFASMYGTFKHQTLDSQSEVLYIINVLLSTFYFSDAWQELKRCDWLKRANKIYNASFSMGKGSPISVDLPRTVTVPEYLRKLPRFQPPRATPAAAAAAGTASPTSPTSTGPASSPPPDGVPSGAARPGPPPSWPLPPFHEMLGRKKNEFARDTSVQMLQDEDDFTDETEHQHSPDTVRKLELLRGLQSFWNAQNTVESRMLDEDSMPEQAAKLAVKVARTLASNKEDPCVEAAACTVLDSYVRTFTHNAHVRGDWSGSCLTKVSDVVLRNLLHLRVYNATLVPTLSQSVRPLRRLENVFALLGELFQYHFPNLLVLARHLEDSVPLADLNQPTKPVNRNDVLLFAPEQKIDSIFETPPLERQETEPFGSVLLRRLFRHGCETNLFISAMLLSVTPRLRSRENYAHRPVPGPNEDATALQEADAHATRWVAVQLPSTPNGRIGDLVSGFSRRFAEARRISRLYVTQLSLAIAPFQARSSSTNAPLLLTAVPLTDPTWRTAVTPLLEALMGQLQNLTHRLTPEERPFVGLFSDQDAALLRGERGLDTFGPHRSWRLPLFGDPADTTASAEAQKLAQLAPISHYILGEPHKLVYSLLCPLNAETMDSTGRMSVVTTTILTFIREAHLHPEDPDAAVHALLKDIAGLAVPTYQAWRKGRRTAARQAGHTTSAPSAAASTQLRPANAAALVGLHATESLPPPQTDATGGASPPTSAASATMTNTAATAAAAAATPPRPVVTTRCTCPETAQDAHFRCFAFVTFGTCHPPNAADQYFRQFGGCFFRNMFRLLCVWIGHYWSCQRYVDTVFFYTQVAFAEFKTMALFLLRELPQYFSAPMLDA